MEAPALDALALDACGQAELVRTGEISPSELVDASIARIEDLDPEINAVIHQRFDKARAQAASPDLPDGPFRGVPFLLKDLWPASAGDPFHQGVQALKDAEYTQPIDSNLVRLYRRAGFVIVGRTNTAELGLSATTEPLAYGPTHNPWDQTRGAGGSSGGSAAAVAAGMVAAANSSDGGGSIRIPAAMCGLVGLKPSRGRLSMGPLQDEWGLSIQHVVSRTVRDTAAILDISSEHSPGDGVLAPGPARPYADEVGADPGRLRIGLLDDASGVDVHPECAALVGHAGRLLESFGHAVDASSPSALGNEDVALQFGLLWSVMAASHMPRLAQLIGRDVVPGDVEPTTWALAEVGRTCSGVDVLRAQEAQHRFRRDLADWWAGGFDLLVTPTTAQPAPVLGELLASGDDALAATTKWIPYGLFTAPWNGTGQPAISYPLGQTDGGLPIGVQLVAAYGREDLLLRVAAQLEAAVGPAQMARVRPSQ